MTKKKQLKKQQEEAKKRVPTRKLIATLPFTKLTWLFVFVIVITTYISFLPSLKNGFVNLDDDRYITDNAKLNVETVKDMFTIPGGFHMGNYHPFPMSVYKFIHSNIDSSPTSYNPYPYHLINILFHILNALLAFFFIRKLTGKEFLGFVAGLLFGIQTMHVESVTWVSELKDVMYGFFYLLTMIAYLRYLDDTSKKRFYFIAIILFLFSLLSKGQATSLSVVLILIDFYKYRKFSVPMLLEKIPFFLLSVVFGVIAVFAQQSMGAMQDIAIFRFYERIIFACYGYVTYLWKLILPMDLSAYYGYPARIGDTLPFIYFLYPVFLILIVGATIYSLKYTRKIFFGIGFYSVTIFLVLQLLPVGGCAISDRYSYIPALGIFYLLGEGLFYLFERKPMGMIASYIIVVVATLGYGYATYNRCTVWKNGMMLWSDVIEKSDRIPLAYNNRGSLYNKEGQKLLDSLKTHQELTNLKPEADAVINKAITDFRRALVLDARDEDALNNLGLAYWRLGVQDTAEHYLRAALAVSPQYAIGWSNLGSVLASVNRMEDALNAYQTAAKYDPLFKDAWYNMGIIQYNLGRKKEACESLQHAAELGMQQAANAVRDLCK